MSEKIDKIFPLIKPFGLNDEETLIYGSLVGKDEASVIEIGKDTGIKRTKVYILIDKLVKLGLVGVSGKENARRFYASSYKQFGIIARERKSEAEMLEDSLPILYEQISQIEYKRKKKSQIIHYKGFDGLKAVTWNSTNAAGIIRVFELASNLAVFLDFDFSERIRIEFVKRHKIKESRQITNIKRLKPWTNISEFVKLWECRFVDPRILSLSTEIAIYNNIVAMYEFKRREIFCLEIYNEDLAATMKNIFDFVWLGAKRMKKLDERGSARVEGKS